MEDRFRNVYMRSTIRDVRVGIVMTAALWALFWVVDCFAVEVDRLYLVVLVRFGIVIPLIALVFGLSFYSKWSTTGYTFLLSAFALMNGAGILTLMWIVGPNTYWAGLMLVLSAMFLIWRLPFLAASSLSVLIVIAMECVLLSGDWTLRQTLEASFFVVSSLCIGMVGGYQYEVAARKTFVLADDLRVEERNLKVRLHQRNVGEKTRVRDARVAAVAEMVAGIAHTLNTPRAIIDNYVLVIRRLVSVADQERLPELPVDALSRIRDNHLLEIEKATKQIGMVTSKLLAIYGNREEWVFRVESIDSIVRDVQERVQSMGDVAISRVSGWTPRIYCCPDQIREALMCILTWSLTGRNVHCITIRTLVEHRSVVVRITDDGVAVDQEAEEINVFLPFYQCHGWDTQSFRLAVAFEIVRRHEGAIRRRSVPGGGAEFDVCLPILLESTVWGPEHGAGGLTS